MVLLLSITDDSRCDHISLTRIEAYLENAGYECEVEYLKNGQMNISKGLSDKIRTAKIIGVNIYFNTINSVFILAQYIKKINPSCFLFVGGAFSNLCTTEILSDCAYIDGIELGHGEETTLQLCHIYDDKNKFLCDSLPSMVTRTSYNDKRPSCLDISSLPWPKRHKFYDIAYIHTKDVCEGFCTFCGASYASRKNLTKRDVRDVFNEIRYLYQEMGVHTIQIVDGTFFDPDGEEGWGWASELADMLIQDNMKIAFKCNARAEMINENRIPILQKLRRAGFTQILVGFESGNDFDLKLYGKKATAEENRKTVEILNKVNINPILGFIMLNPYSTHENLTKNYYFLKECKNVDVYKYASRLSIVYKTPIYFQMVKDGLLRDDYAYHNCSGGYIMKDTSLESINHIIGKFHEDANLMNLAGQIRNFELRYDTLLAIVDDLGDLQREHYLSLRNQIANLLATYFKILFVDYDLELFEKEYMTFLQEYTYLVRKAQFESTKYYKMMLNYTCRS